MNDSLNPRACEILEEAAAVLQKKGEDYAGGSVKDTDYFKYDGVPGMPLMYTKILRYYSLMTQGGAQNFEGVEDTLKDLINYAARTIAYLESQEAEGEEQELDAIARDILGPNFDISIRDKKPLTPTVQRAMDLKKERAAANQRRIKGGSSFDIPPPA